MTGSTSALRQDWFERTSGRRGLHWAPAEHRSVSGTGSPVSPTKPRTSLPLRSGHSTRKNTSRGLAHPSPCTILLLTVVHSSAELSIHSSRVHTDLVLRKFDGDGLHQGWHLPCRSSKDNFPGYCRPMLRPTSALELLYVLCSRRDRPRPCSVSPKRHKRCSIL